MILRGEELRLALKRARKEQDMTRLAHLIGQGAKALEQPDNLQFGSRALLTVILQPSDRPLVERLSEMLGLTTAEFMKTAEWPPYKMPDYTQMDPESALTNGRVHAGVLRVIKLYDMRRITKFRDL
jgi:hypothetical protein